MNTDDEPRAGSAAAPAADPREPQTSKALQGRLLQVSRLAAMGEMASGLAHELNQPLTAIANYAHACDRLLARPAANLVEVREALRQIGSQTTRAADIIQRLRKLAGGQHGEHAPANVNALVQELHELLLSDARPHGVEVSLELDPQLPEVSVDAGQIQQAVLNFFRNSVDTLVAGPARRPLLVVIRTSATADHHVELAVIDNGPGLAPGLTERVFDPFFSNRADGTGLGLAISNTIARAHGGSVGYRPHEPAGACFYIRLPARPRTTAAEP
jgi:two-component system sensor kinase FixL